MIRRAAPSAVALAGLAAAGAAALALACARNGERDGAIEVSGFVEAFSRRPRVRDLESLPEDILSVRGFWRNRVTRILLVVVFTNLGAAMGTVVAFPLLMGRLLESG